MGEARKRVRSVPTAGGGWNILEKYGQRTRLNGLCSLLQDVLDETHRRIHLIARKQLPAEAQSFKILEFFQLRPGVRGIGGGRGGRRRRRSRGHPEHRPRGLSEDDRRGGQGEGQHGLGRGAGVQQEGQDLDRPRRHRRRHRHRHRRRRLLGAQGQRGQRRHLLQARRAAGEIYLLLPHFSFTYVL